MGDSAADTDDNNINLALWQARNFQLKTDADISPAKLADIHRNNIFQLSDIVNNFNISADFATAQLAKEQRCYAAVIDDSNRSVGLDNFSAKALSLAADCKTENGDWKSGIAENSMLQLDFVKNALGSRSTLETKLELEKSNLINRQLLSGNDNNFVKFSAVKEPRIVSSPIHHHKNVVQSRDDNNPKLDYDSDTIRLTKDSDHKDCKSKRIRLDGEAGKKDSKEQLGFRSARDQLVAEQASKNQKSFAQNQKKSLGSRPRNQCYAKFIPPNRDKDDSDDDISASRKSDPASAPDVKAEAHPKLKGVDQQLIDLVVSEIMDHGPPVEWDHIAGLEYAKATIKEIVIWPMLRPDLFTGLRGPPKGILLFGPPGTGKTLIGKCIASQSRATFFSISASSLTSKWIGQGEKMVRALFVVAGMHQPAVIFIDEIDSLLSQRSDTEHESSRRIKTEFLIHLDGATTSSEDRILVVGATNRPHEIDEAARRRLVKRLYIPLPDAPARKQMMTNLMRDQPFRLSDDDVDAIVGRTDGFSGADVTNLCKEAALGPIRSLQGLDIARVSKEQVRPIEVADFEAALKHVKASVSNNDLRLYEDWNKTFGCGST